MARVLEWLDRLEARPLRERLLLLAATLAVLVLLGDWLWLTPQSQKAQRWAEKIHKAEQESIQFQAQIAKLQAALREDPDARNRQQLQAILQQSRELDLRLRSEQNTMIDPVSMPQVLEQMLGELPLVLVSLRKLPPQIEIDSQVKGVPKVYRHGLRIELEGSYDDTLDYLGRLESLPWRLSWQSMDIQVRAYPKASIVLTLYTLSFEEGWLGV